ncbi:uncharacterized protein [Leptinotarsa decemlineata]|uniref:uncharacterized protein n=1 Tax=Leptinotarsa decemlineata TaxID=7539 RepID=UPI003D3095F9
MGTFTPKKRSVKNSPLSVCEKVIILNVYDCIKHDHPSLSVQESVERCARMTGIGQSTIFKLLRERKISGQVSPCKRKSGRPIKILDEDTKCDIRRKVHSFYFKKEIPTLEKIFIEISQDNDIPLISRKLLWKTLKSMNFAWEKHNRKALLLESDEIVCWRRKYLTTIKQYRREQKKIFYLDETWINEGYIVKKMWQDKNITSSRQAFIEGLSTGIKVPSGKGKRLIIAHIGSEDGFLKEGLLSFESCRTGDYHEDMNSDVFEDYFGEMLKFLSADSVVVMDNASYHSRRLEKVPTSAWRKQEIINWLSNKGIQFETNSVKKELLAIVKQHKSRFMKYAVEDVAEKYKVTVLRLPPYHCELNPIELIWAQVKGYVARHNTTFKMKDVKVLFDQAIMEITSENWQKAIQHVLKEEDKMWELDNLVDQVVDPIIITPGDDDSSSDEDYTDVE